ncbi:MAG TPA: hypothetical protein VNO14_07275 [Blastocatellia bacterium]|nr:hypothetical protein [Blastocatellia bacterium]
MKTRGKGAQPDAKKLDARRQPKKQKEQKKRKSINPLIVVPVLLMAIILFGAGSFIAMTLWQDGQAGDPGSLEAVLDKVRGLPSSQSGKTIEEYLDQQVKMSRQEGRLLEAQGWGVRATEGKHFLVTFTFEEKGNRHHRAEWEVDLGSNKVTAKNELAAKIYKKE